MSISLTVRRSWKQLFVVVCGVPTLASFIHAQTPDQMPLLTKAGPAVVPNVMLTMDDSGSMAFRHMPEDVFAADTFATANPVNSRTVRWDPNDDYQIGVNFVGTVPGVKATTNWVAKAMRSADTNTIFYNPEIRYQPWFNPDGSRRANSPVNKAYKNPLDQTGAAGTYVNLTTYVVPAGDSNWCYSQASTSAPGSGGCASRTNSAVTHDPGVYFRLDKTGLAYKAVNNASNYTAYSINDPGPFTKYTNRTDCAGTTCTQAEERQNFANWFSYYRNRNLLARGSLMEAFGVEAAPVTAGTFIVGAQYAVVSVGSTDFTSIGAASNTVDTVFTATGAGTGTGTARAITMRLGFGRINKSSAAVDGVNTAVIESNTATYGGGGVRDFNFARKTNLFKWLEDLPASGGTPLVTALQSIGTYYSRTDNRGPWTDNPATTSNTVANNRNCRRSYNIMMTDGYWNGATVSVGNQDNTDGTTILGDGQSYIYRAANPFKDSWSNTLADVSMKYWKTDLQPATDNKVPPVADNTSFWQNMTSYTVGLGVRGTLDPNSDLPALTAGTKTWPEAKTSATGPNVDDLWHAAVNSRGRYFSAKDPQELSYAIRTALAGATGGSGATAGVATASTVLSADNRKYIPTFVGGSWSGDIGSYPLDADGQVGAAVWKAADRMPDYNGQTWSGRNIVTWDPSTWGAVTFAWSSLSATSKAAMGTVANTHGQTFIDFLKGDHTKEGVGNPFRTRLNSAGKSFILGDIVNSNPVLIQGNFDGVYSDTAWGGKSAYDAFKATKAARTAVLFTGGNDGMLHAFKDSKAASASSEVSDGQEIFAYVPRAVYANLEKLADKNYGTTTSLRHQYFVDGPLHEADAFVKAPGASAASWRNYLFGSLGAGGRAVFALDVTNTSSMNASTVRWELSSDDHADIGYVLSPIKVGVTPGGRWIAVFGNGFGSTGFSSTSGNAVLFVVDLENAASTDSSTRATAVQKLVLDNTGNNGLGGVTLIPDIVTGRTTSIYAGDLKGNLWKIKYDSGTSAYAVDGTTALFTATDSMGTAQPITSSPVVYNHSQGGRMLVFGTGKLFSTTDGTDTSDQSVYGVWDKTSDTVPHPLQRSNLEGRTLTVFSGSGAAASTKFISSTGAAVDYSGSQRGWYIDLSSSITGGRVIYPTQVVGYTTALVSSVAPVQGTPAACDSGKGSALNLLVPVETGANEPSSRVLDTNGDGVANASDPAALGYKTTADGIDAVLSSATTGMSGNNPLADVGGGGPEGDCTGATCSKKGRKCVQDARCAVGTCLASIQSATMGLPVCVPVGTVGQRVWRRIINPPIR